MQFAVEALIKLAGQASKQTLARIISLCERFVAQPEQAAEAREPHTAALAAGEPHSAAPAAPEEDRSLP